MANIICKSWKGVLRDEIKKKYYINCCLKHSQTTDRAATTRWQCLLINHPGREHLEGWWKAKRQSTFMLNNVYVILNYLLNNNLPGKYMINSRLISDFFLY